MALAACLELADSSGPDSPPGGRVQQEALLAGSGAGLGRKYCTSVQILRLHNLLGPWLHPAMPVCPGPAMEAYLAQLRSCYLGLAPWEPQAGVRL